MNHDEPSPGQRLLERIRELQERDDSRLPDNVISLAEARARFRRPGGRLVENNFQEGGKHGKD